MILGTKSRYAVMAMVELAGHKTEEPVRLSELAEAQEITVPYLEQIFSKLKQAGLVKSVRGPGGGYVLARPATLIYVGDVVMAVEEAIKMTRCANHPGKKGQATEGCMAARTRCLTHDLWEGLEKHIYSYLHSVTLADVRARAVSPVPEQFAVAKKALIG